MKIDVDGLEIETELLTKKEKLIHDLKLAEKMLEALIMQTDCLESKTAMEYIGNGISWAIGGVIDHVD